MKNYFIIINSNDFTSTKHLIDNIKNYKIIDHILVVDNNSINCKELESLKSKNDEIIYNDINLGYSCAINKGVKYLVNKYGEGNLIISNSDIVIMSENDLVKLINHLNDENVGIVGPQILEKGLINRGRKNYSPKVEVLFDIPVIRHFIFDKYSYYDLSLYNANYTDVDIVSSCFFLIKSSVLESINYMDENIFLYYEDNILCKKIKNNNLVCRVINDVKIKHLYGVSVNKTIKMLKKFKIYFNSQLYYHFTYNNASLMDKILLRIVRRVAIIWRTIKLFVLKKN